MTQPPRWVITMIIDEPEAKEFEARVSGKLPRKFAADFLQFRAAWDLGIPVEDVIILDVRKVV